MRRLCNSLSFIFAAALQSAALVGLMEPWLFAGHARVSVLLCHLAGSVLFVAALWPGTGAASGPARSVITLLLAGLCGMFPLLGPALACVAVRLVFGTDKKPGPQREYYFGEERYLTNSVPANIAARSSRSISEMLYSPDVGVRRQAVLAAGNLEPARAIPILRQAQQDSDEQVRIFARNFLARIVETLEAFLKLAQQPEPDPVLRLERLIDVVDRNREFISLGLLNESSRQSYIERCFQLLEQARETQDDDEKLLCLAMKLYLLDGQLDRACASLEQLKQLSANPNVTLPWELQLTYQKRDWPRLQTLLIYLEEHCYNDPNFKRIYDFWRKPARQSVTAALGERISHPPSARFTS